MLIYSCLPAIRPLLLRYWPKVYGSVVDSFKSSSPEVGSNLQKLGYLSSISTRFATDISTTTGSDLKEIESGVVVTTEINITHQTEAESRQLPALPGVADKKDDARTFNERVRDLKFQISKLMAESREHNKEKEAVVAEAPESEDTTGASAIMKLQEEANQLRGQIKELEAQMAKESNTMRFEAETKDSASGAKKDDGRRRTFG